MTISKYYNSIRHLFKYILTLSMSLRIVFILFCCFPFMILGKNSQYYQDIKIGTVWFQGKSSKLSNEARLALDSFIREIQKDTTLKVQAVAYNKDFCSKCGNRSWKRATVVLTYLSRRGISEDRLTFTNILEGDFNKVDLFFVSSK